MIEHYNEWGWINFLSSVAESGLFNTPDNIQAAKNAKAYNILVWSSEKKDYNDSYNADLKH